MAVQVYQTWDDRLAGGIDDLGADRHGRRFPWTDRLDAVIANHDDRVSDRIGARAIDQLGPDNR